MGIVFTLIISLAAGLIVGITKKYYIDNSSSGVSGCFIFNAVGCLVAAVVMLCWGGFKAASLFTVLLGISFGAVTALANITNVAALWCGPMSYTQVIISFSTLISALSGALFFDENLGWAQTVGIVLMLISFAFATENDKGERTANLKWLLLCLASFAATGGIGIMQKVHQNSVYKAELNEFLIVAFAASTAFCSLTVLFLKKRKVRKGTENKRKAEINKRQLWILLGVMLVSGVCTALNNKFNLYLSGVMDSAVFFPIVNGGGLVLTTLAAVTIFKEKLTKKQWIGVAFGIVSVVFLCNPFV